MSPGERTQRARIAGLTRALRDPDHHAPARARAGLERSWGAKALAQLGPDATDAQIAAVAATLRKLHYARMSAAGVKARAR